MLELFNSDLMNTLVNLFFAGAIGLLGHHIGLRSRLSVLEKAVGDLEVLVAELRQDIKQLISYKH